MLFSTNPLGREINGVKFTSDGRRIICALSSKKLAVLDVETGQATNCYDNCCFGGNSRDFVRLPIATDTRSPFLAVSPYINNRGITIYDTRMPLVYDFICDVHTSDIRDIIFFDNSWPFVPKQHQGVACLASDGTCRIVSLDGKILHHFEIGHKANSMARTPESFDQMSKTEFKSAILAAGDRQLSCYTPEPSSYENMKMFSRTFGLVNHSSLSTSFGIQEYLSHLHFGLNISPNSTSNTLQSISNHHSSVSHPQHHHLTSTGSALFAQNSRRLSGLIKSTPLEDNISLLKYGTNGGLLYAIANSNQSHCVQRFRRYPNEHRLIDVLYSHKSEIYDMDISAYDEFIVTASRDRSVGVMCLGSPNHGSTSVSELT